MVPILESVAMRDAGAVVDVLLRGAAANRSAACRRGSMDVVDVAEDGVPKTVVLTGDLHDNPLHLARLVIAAGMSNPATATPELVRNLVLHELIHSDRLLNGMDFSYRVLARVAALKVAFPERVHLLLANHEIAQLIGSLVTKDGIRCNQAFDDAIDSAFGDDASRVIEAVREFIRSMPLAARFTINGERDVVCAHSLPPEGMLDRFDMGVLDRDLTDADFEPRRGSAHLMTWGRDHTPAHVRSLGEAWRASLFVVGHEKAETGVAVLEPNTLVLNSDHDRGVYLPLDMTGTRDPEVLAGQVIALSP